MSGSGRRAPARLHRTAPPSKAVRTKRQHSSFSPSESASGGPGGATQWRRVSNGKVDKIQYGYGRGETLWKDAASGRSALWRRVAGLAGHAGKRMTPLGEENVTHYGPRPSGSRPTIRDVAATAAEALQAVSNVVDGRPHPMTLATRGRVAAMADHRYRPNAAGARRSSRPKGVRSGRSAQAWP